VFNDLSTDLLDKGGELIEAIDTAGVVGGPTIEQVQNKVKLFKRHRREGTHGKLLTQVNDLVTVVENNTLPESLASLAPIGTQSYMIPMEMELLNEAQAVCFVGSSQIKWVTQLANTAFKYTLHIDGVHKLHHGGWLLITIGPHVLSQQKADKTVTHSYRPCVYMFTKEESMASTRVLCRAMNYVAMQYTGKALNPAAVNMDCSDKFRAGVLAEWPMARVITCWPHIKGKVKRGEYVKLTNSFHERFAELVTRVHFAKTASMARLLADMAGKEMDVHLASTPELRTFWNTYMQGAWMCWSLGHCDGIPSQIANNQPIETWHRWGVKQCKGELKKSTAEVLNASIPKLMKRDGILCYRTISLAILLYHSVSTLYRPYRDTAVRMPAILRLDELPMEWIVKEQYTTARLLEMNSSNNIFIESATPIQCYVLTTYGRDNFKKISQSLVNRCVSIDICLYQAVSPPYHLRITLYLQYRCAQLQTCLGREPPCSRKARQGL